MATTLKYKYPDINNSVALSWTTTDINADHYKVYRRILENNVNYTCIKEQSDSSYTDANVLTKANLHAPEISINTQKEYGKIKIYLINNIENSKTYIYYVETYDQNNNIVSSSNKIQIEISNNPDSYSYLIKVADTPITKHDAYTKTQDSCVILSNMDNGKYVVYAYVQIGDIKSDTAQARFIVDNTIFVTKQYLDIPSAVRYNNRYRGPQESRKKDFAIIAIKNNINKLKKRVDYLDEYKSGILGKPETINVEITNLIETIENSLSDIRKELKYEGHNN